ncbi:LOW QUALITY PROTEIN: hypothetical protein KUTeg_022868 [Tegillarca granosa]|uniref:Amino acid transporter n=1 Tax=Tegillarca granosa TaxID=220873 RepID=A0ABQ9E008_TEGGR|nr:LOW QUALITY PROTEIN: hypothetical protein KUTeg_022868 [Tegillarca granosa]
MSKQEFEKKHNLFRMSPIGVMSLIAVSIAKVDTLQQTFKILAEYIGVYTAGVLIYQLIIIPGLYFVVTRKNPAKFLLSVVRPMMVVLAPPASVIAIPEMIKTCEEDHGVNSKLSRFVIPLGTAFSRAGSCYFICLSCFLLISMNDYSVFSALPSIPSASIYGIIVVLTSLNMSIENIGILVALEWYTDRLRSVSNALNIVVGTIMLDKFCKKSLTKSEKKRSYPTTDMEITIDDSTDEML